MSDADRSKLGFDPFDTQLEDRQPVAEDDVSALKRLVEQLTQQVADLDRQNVAATHELRTEIADLGAAVGRARYDVPEPLAPAFARAEEAIADLATLVADGYAGSDDAAVHDAQQEVADRAPDNAATAPPVLLSAVETDADLGGWDIESANALMKLNEEYAPADDEERHSPADELGVDAVAPEVVDTAVGGHVDATVVTPGPYAVPSQGGAVTLEPSERSWFDERFSEIAQQVAMSGGPPVHDVSRDALMARIDSLEENVGSAVLTAATRVEVPAVDELGEAVRLLTQEVGEARMETARVAEIERHVQALGERLSDEGLLEVLTPLIAAENQDSRAAGSVDFEELANTVALRLSEQIAKLPTRDQIQSDLASLKSLVSDVVAQQRAGENGLNVTLEALQQAMVRLLDRVDAIEQSQLSLAERLSVTPAHPGQIIPGNLRGEQDRSAPDNPEARVAASLVDQPMRATGPAANLKEPSWNENVGGVEQRAQAPQPPTSDGSDAGDGLDERLRKRRDFSAAARRAAARASERAAQAASAEQRGPEPRGGAALPQQTGTEAKPAKTKAKKRSLFRVWAAGVVLVAVALGASHLVLSLYGQPTRTAPVMVTANEAPVVAGVPKPRPVAPAQASATVAPAKDTGADNDSFPLGIAVAASGPASPNALAVTDRRKVLATLSSRTGASVPTATAIPDTLIPRAPETVTGSPGGSVTARAAMPPAQIGPSSLRAAAAKGDPSAEFEIGTRYAEGRGVSQDFKKAAEWYGRAAKRGFAIAEYRLATLYERGMGLPADVRIAKALYARAAAGGNIKAMHNLAVIVAGTEAGTRDYKSAAKWFSKAAAFGLADSQYNIGILYQNGLGVKRDLQQAYHWFALAAKSGDKEAARLQTALASSLTPDQKRAADLAVLAWRPQPYNRTINDAATAGRMWQSPSSPA